MSKVGAVSVLELSLEFSAHWLGSTSLPSGFEAFAVGQLVREGVTEAADSGALEGKFVLGRNYYSKALLGFGALGFLAGQCAKSLKNMESQIESPSFFFLKAGNKHSRHR